MSSKYDGIVAPKPTTPARSQDAPPPDPDVVVKTARPKAARKVTPNARPPLSRDTTRRSLTLYVDTEIHQLMKMELAAERLTFSEVIETLLLRWLHETPQRARRPVPHL